MIDYALLAQRPNMEGSARYVTTDRSYPQPGFSASSENSWQSSMPMIQDHTVLYDGVDGIHANSLNEWQLANGGFSKPQLLATSSSKLIQPIEYNVNVKSEYISYNDPYLSLSSNSDLMLSDESFYAMPSPPSSLSTPLSSPEGEWMITGRRPSAPNFHPEMAHPSPVRPRSLPQLDAPGSQFLVNSPESSSKALHSSKSSGNLTPPGELEKPRKRRRISRAQSTFSGSTLMKSTIPGITESSSSSGSFGVFVVETAPSPNEPLGGTYMSTVNLQSLDATPSFDHGPTDLPPRPYAGGPDAVNLWKPRKDLGTIPGSAMEYLPALEARLHRLERAVDNYVEYRGQQALRNSILPEHRDEQ